MDREMDGWMDMFFSKINRKGRPCGMTSADFHPLTRVLKLPGREKLQEC